MTAYIGKILSRSYRASLRHRSAKVSRGATLYYVGDFKRLHKEPHSQSPISGYHGKVVFSLTLMEEITILWAEQVLFIRYGQGSWLLSPHVIHRRSISGCKDTE